MKKFGEFICNNNKIIILISCILLVLSVIGMKLTKVNYDILVYLPTDIETIKGQNILTNEYNMGSYSTAVVTNMSSKDLLKLEKKIRLVDGVNDVISIYDVVGTTIPVEMLPNEITEKVHQDNSDLLLITFADSTSSERTLNAVKEIRNITSGKVNQGGMSSMVLDTMNLSEKEILIYIIIAVLLCIVVLEISLDSYIIPFILLANIGFAILFNLGTNVFLGQISYITKALVAVLQLGVTTDFSIFLYHAYENKKSEMNDNKKAMVEAIKETFTSVTGSSLTTIAGFLVLCAMNLTLGKDLGIVMAKGVFLGVITVLTLFPSLLLIFDKVINKTKHKKLIPTFTKLNKFVIKHHIAIFIIFILLIVPMYLANNKVNVYYKLDKSLPETLESIKTNKVLKEKFNIVSPEIIIIDKNIKNDDILKMTKEIFQVDGIDFILSFAKLKNAGITENMVDKDITQIFENDKYQMLLLNSTYDIATVELNEQTVKINDIVKKYDANAIVAGEGPLMKDLVEISDTDFKHVNLSSIICIFLILFIVLKSLSLPFLLITSIEFAIFTNMGISYFNGTTLPFIAPIVLGTIQLGATIDYAILLTTTYLNKRSSGLNKKDAMLETLNYSGLSILTSSMCFFAATFGVGLYSQIEMIGALCTLISRGALISMFVVINILPAILLIFDKLIIKTTLDKGKEIKMKKIIKIKGISKKVLAILLLGMLTFNIPITAFAFTKNETVYSKLNYDGSVKNTFVNEQLINSSNSKTIEDYTELKDILNINNDSTYTLNKNKIVWNANGNDVFYQGTTNKELPIKVKITYKLNGKETSLNDMLGKSGKVTITLKYLNTDKHNINGSILYTPFVVTMGTIIDGENNKNITVTNGKVVSNGTKNIIAALAVPGLYESLNISELKDFDTIEINYETTNFELSSIYSIVTPKIIETSDLDIFNKLNSLTSSVNSLQNNMNKIDDGAKALSNGVNELKENYSVFHNGMGLINNGSYSLNHGTKELSAGISKLAESKSSINELKASVPVLLSSIENLTDGNNTYTEKFAVFTTGTNEFADGAAAYADGTASYVNNTKTYINGAVGFASNASSLLNNVNNYLDNANSYMSNTNNYFTNVNNYVTNNNAILEQIISTIDVENATSEQLALYNNALALINSGNSLKTSSTSLSTASTNLLTVGNNLQNACVTLNTNSAPLISSGEKILAGADKLISSGEKIAQSSETIKTSVNKLQEGNQTINTGLNTLNNNIQGLSLVPDKLTELTNGIDKLNEGAIQITDGTENLYSGINVLYNNSSKVLEGIDQLNSGANTLSAGISIFNTEGINKISNLVNNNVVNMASKLEKLSELSDSYNSFASKDSSAKGETKFILVVDSKSAPKENNNVKQVETKTTLWQRIKNIFK